MNKFKYLRISKTKKLRFIDNYYKKKLYLVFLHGFMSDIEGTKPQSFRICKKKEIGFFSNGIFRAWKVIWKVYSWQY